MQFKLVSKFKPTGDQPQAIKKLAENIKAGNQHNVLLGVTGSGKTYTVANVIEKLQMPTLVISPNKTLCAQLYQELKEFFPENAAHYFVSYYDYYQPEAYIPQTDTYIEKDAKINEQIDHLRHAAVQDLISRNDTIVVASVSCIYNLGSPENYRKVTLEIKQRQKISRKDFLACLVDLQYQRNDFDFKPGTFRVRGDIVEINLITGENILKVEFFGNEIHQISTCKERSYLQNNTSSSNTSSSATCRIFPANFWTAEEAKMKIAIQNIKAELNEQLKKLKKQNKLVEAQRLEQRTNYDVEMMQTSGVCSGIENYSSHLEFRKPGQAPFTLLDYFSSAYSRHSRKNSRHSYLTIIDESHIAIPQLHAMYNTDRARKNVLIEHGFRLPSALDNRPLAFTEFEKKLGPVIYSSATPGQYELQKAKVVEQLVRPTGLLEPSIEIRPTKNQVQDLIKEAKKRIKKGQRTICVTLTKRMAEDLAVFLSQKNVKAEFLHSEVKTMERPEILRNFRQGKFDVIVGVNLLREGLDLPEVSLIGILDADKEGFLRNETMLIQTMGRAARHLEGHVILYGDKTTVSMQKAIKEIARRRKLQIAYNKKHKINPKAIIKEIRGWSFGKKESGVELEFGLINDIKMLTQEMNMATKNLNFERAIELRDLIFKLKHDKKELTYNFYNDGNN